MKIGIVSLILFALFSSLCYAEVLVAKDQYLFKPASEARRLLLEPGAILLRKDIPKDQVFRKRIRVISLGGVEGEVRSKGIDSINDMSQKLAYVKNEFEIKENKYSIGTVFPLKILEEEDETIYKITYPKTSYSVKHNGFIVKAREIEISSEELDRSFNIINPSQVPSAKFPLWIRDTKHSQTQWGCEWGSKEEVLEVDASVITSVKAEGGFFSFFQAKAETSGGVSKTITYRKKLEDNEFKHRVSYWNLVSATDPSEKILSIALEKISVCDASKGVNNSYIIRFEQSLSHDEIKINSIWVEEKKFKRGGGSPLRIDTQDDLHKFEEAMKDFRFLHTKDRYDIKKAVIDFAMQYTVNLNYAP